MEAISMKTETPFSILAMVRAKKANTWGRIDSAEFRAVSDQAERYGIPDTGYDSIPWNSLSTRATPLTAASSSGGGFLDQTNLQGYLPALQPQTNLLRLGATIVSLDKGDTVIPHGTSALSPTWLTSETVATSSVTPTFGQASLTRKTVLVSVPVSRQLLLQSNAEEAVRTELVRGVGAGIDLAGIQGLGVGGVPLGLLNIPSITNASGATLAYATMVSVMEQVANANAVTKENCLGWLTTPNVAGLLKQRYFSAANFPIWTGSVPSGTIDLQTSLSTTNVPAGNLIHGDFSQLLIAQWTDGLQIDVDPYTNFQNAVVTIRLCVSVDFVVPNPLGFSILTGVT
jgi:HK97 family phage major capsid protein